MHCSSDPPRFRSAHAALVLGLLVLGALGGGISGVGSPARGTSAHGLGAGPAATPSAGIAPGLEVGGMASPTPAAVSPLVNVSFDGLSLADNSVGLAPPDPILSVGPSHVVEMVNLVMGIYTRTGGLVSKIPLSTFFGTGSDFISDPKVQYDPASGRWFASVTDVGSSEVRLAVSSGSDPNGTWTVYPLSDGLGNDCLDQPILGVGGDKVVVSVNVFSTCTGSNPSYLGAEWWVLAKADLVAWAASPATQLFPTDPSLFSVHPAQGNGTTLYMVSTNWTQSASANRVTLFRLTGLPPLVLITRQDLAIRSVSVPPPAAQLGSNRSLDTGDIRVQDAAEANGVLWFSLGTGCRPPGDTASGSCVRILELDVGTPAILQDVDLGAPGVDYFYPALRADGRGDLIVVFGASSGGMYPSVLAATRVYGDPLGTVGPPLTVREGVGPESCSSATCRFGDYFGAAVDPMDSRVVWGAGQFGRGAAGWGTHVFSGSVKALLTAGYAVVGGGTGYSPPVLTYVANGQTVEAPLGLNETAHAADPGTPWNVTIVLGNSSSTDWWTVNPAAAPATSGISDGSWSATFTYYHQYAVGFDVGLVGAGSPMPPAVSFVRFGTASMANASGATVAVDAGSPWTYPATLPGATMSDRWTAQGNLTGLVPGPPTVRLSYYHQYRVTFEYAVGGGAWGPPPHVVYVAFGAGAQILANGTVWADEGASYAYDADLAGSGAAQRWHAGPGAAGTVLGPATVTVTYREQFFVSVCANPEGAAGLVTGGGWYDAGAVAWVQASSSEGWRFAGWTGTVAGSGANLSVAVEGPVNETATFEVGLTLAAGPGGSVAFAAGATTGIVAANDVLTVYVPEGTTVSLTAQPGSLLEGFAGWSGAVSGSAPHVSVVVRSPSSVRADFTWNLMAILGLSTLAVLAVLGVVLLLLVRRRRHPPPGT